MIKKLKVNDIYKKCELKEKFKTTSDLDELECDLVGQNRAKNALNYGLSINKYGYNIFLSGVQSSRKKKYLESVLNRVAKDKPVPNDLCYVNNFKDDTNPILLKFSPGEGEVFKKSIGDFAEDIKENLTQVFSSNNYTTELEIIEQKYEKEWRSILKEYQSRVMDNNFMLIQTKEGYHVPTPLDIKGRVIVSERKLDKYISKYEKQYLEDRDNVNMIVLEMLHEESNLEEKKEKEIQDFDKEKVTEIIDEKIKPIYEKYSNENEKIKVYLEGIKEYIVDNLDIFKPKEVPQNSEINIIAMMQEEDSIKLEEYSSKLSVNLIVNNRDLKSAPVIFAKDIDEYSLFGGMVFDTDKRTSLTKTDFTKIFAGDIVKANGGYLVLNVEELIMNNMWNNLKKVIKNKEIKFSSKNLATVILSDAIESEEIEIDMKIILIGDEETHYVLYENDLDFRELFEVHSKFESVCDRTLESELEYAKLITKYCKESNLKPLTYDAVCRVIEYSSRIAESQSKLVLHYSEIYRLLIEADSLATSNNKSVIELSDIKEALDNYRYRVDIATERFIERDKKNTIITTVDGYKVGEINALSVLDYGEFTIGAVSKITANTYKNKEYGIISVDKEAEMSGPYHDKCVSIIQGFLGEQFAKENPLSLAVNLSFEQSYGGIDGDSATLAETCAILSNLSNTPIKQSIGITGSMNQKGEAQVIGGVNDKIEGFYRTCKAKNPNSKAGVIIPKSNIEDLMLSEEIISAVHNEEFEIYAIENIDDAVKILMDIEYKELKKEIIS